MHRIALKNWTPKSTYTNWIYLFIFLNAPMRLSSSFPSRQHPCTRILTSFGLLIRSLSILACYFQVVPRVKNVCCFEVLHHPLGKWKKRWEREREKDGSKRWPIKVNWAIGQTFKVFLYREIASSDKQVCWCWMPISNTTDLGGIYRQKPFTLSVVWPSGAIWHSVKPAPLSFIWL